MFRSSLPGALGASPMRILASVGLKVYPVSMRYDSAVEKLGVAVHRLVGLGDIKDRLHQAYLSFEPLQPEDLPEHLRDEFRELKNALTWLPVDEPGQQEGTLASTLDRMSDGEADRLARKIYELYSEVRHFSYESEYE
jgi:hypothetical protein